MLAHTHTYLRTVAHIRAEASSIFLVATWAVKLAWRISVLVALSRHAWPRADKTLLTPTVFMRLRVRAPARPAFYIHTCLYARSWLAKII